MKSCISFVFIKSKLYGSVLVCATQKLLHYYRVKSLNPKYNIFIHGQETVKQHRMCFCGSLSMTVALVNHGFV